MITRNIKRKMLEAELDIYKKRKFTCSNCNHQEELYKIPNILLPVYLPIKAQTFLRDNGVEIPSNYLMSRNEFISHFHDYINLKNLKVLSSNNMCIIDTHISKLFLLSNDSILSYNEFNKHMYKLFIHHI